MQRCVTISVLIAACGCAAPAQTFTTLFSFDGLDGALPGYGSLVQGLNGDLYGTTVEGGSSGYGTVFSLSPQGVHKRLYSFATDGAYPWAGLVIAPNGLFYGTTSSDTGTGGGTVFKMTPSGTLTTMYTFNPSGVAYPMATLVEGFDGMLWGTTDQDYGAIFRISPKGALTTVYTLSGGAGGQSPNGLVQARNGILYGTTAVGGTGGYGTIFSITASGIFQVIHSFTDADGASPVSGLTEGSDGLFYGTAYEGGNCAASIDGCGTVFSVTASGSLTVLHAFDETDGWGPEGTLVQGTDGNFYGTTAFGGMYGYGTIFQITPGGALTTLHNFDSTDGCNAHSGLVQATDGSFYGTTYGCGKYGDGTIYNLSMGLGPFIKTINTFGKPGAAVAIAGTDLTGATSVTFNGTAASFTVVSATEIETTVPAGATSGTVVVVLPGETLSSIEPFQVL